MTDPRPALAPFLAAQGWSPDALRPLAGDASLRRYWRLRDAARCAVVMDAPPETGEDIGPFCRVAADLQRLGVSVPKIVAADPDAGLILMEDLGDDLYATCVARAPAQEQPLYTAAVDLLADLAQHPVAQTYPDFSAEMPALAGLAARWYAGTPDAAPKLAAEMATALQDLPATDPVLVHRDFHAQNLLWLPARSGLRRVGVLDFQDAARGPVGYDLISLLHDARRDVTPALRGPLQARYAAALGLDEAQMDRICATLLAQRSLRILGVFARLSLHFGKPAYIDLIPRVWGQLQQALTHPALDGLAHCVTSHLPQPDPTHLDDLRARCGTIPTRS